MIIFLIFSEENYLKQLKLGTLGEAGRVSEWLEENEFLISATLLLKKVTNQSARPFLDSQEVSTASVLECSASVRSAIDS